ncbi:MAG TPA: TatD family deoxyribonuclease [Coxiellaceae bacterium]|nr:TatD family deoxyribonuclease [Coxiellaceae bacterium]
MLADSHCHLDMLDLEPYGGDIHNAIAAARAKGVKYILCPGTSVENFPAVLKIVETDQNLFAAVGVHPGEENVYQPNLQELINLAQNKKVVAIGETGLDFYYIKDEIKRKQQIELFRLHIQAAKSVKKPLILHARDADLDIIRILQEEEIKKVGGVMHCFTGSLDMAKAALDLGFYISFSGIVTFKNAEHLRNIAKNVPVEKILIETDSPYLAPMPVRGKSNEPLYLPYIAEFMANLLGISYEAFAAQTTENFLQFCHI